MCADWPLSIPIKPSPPPSCVCACDTCTRHTPSRCCRKDPPSNTRVDAQREEQTRHAKHQLPNAMLLPAQLYANQKSIPRKDARRVQYSASHTPGNTSHWPAAGRDGRSTGTPAAANQSALSTSSCLMAPPTPSHSVAPTSPLLACAVCNSHQGAGKTNPPRQVQPAAPLIAGSQELEPKALAAAAPPLLRL